jgi:hypothetical protein
MAEADTTITRSAFNRVRVRLSVVQPGALYTVALDGELFSYTSETTDGESDILNGLAALITDRDFTVTVDAEALRLIIELADTRATSVLTLSGNLTTQSVTGIVRYLSEIKGIVNLPDGVITEIVTQVTGLISAVNLLPSISGRLRENDVELRQSYSDKIFNRSTQLLESIRSSILLEVQGVRSAVGYQNDTNLVDADGRWPHCIEMVVDGGDEYEIASIIWRKKAAGIQTFGETEVEMRGNEGELVTVRFNRPEYVFVWFQITVTLNPAEVLPPNYVDAIKEIVNEAMKSVQPGRPLIPQRLIDHHIYSTVPGIANIFTETFHTTDPNEQPSGYEFGVVPITPRQKAVTDDTRIEVLLSG